MISRSIKRISLRALIVDDELGTPTAEGRAARALVTEMQGRNIEVIEATLGRRRPCRDHLGFGHPCPADRLVTGRRQESRARACAHRVRPLTQRQDPDLPAGRARRSGRHSGRHHGQGGRIHLDARGHRRVRRWPHFRRDPPLSRSHDAAAGRGDDEVHAGLRVLLAHAGPPGRHRVPQVAGGAHFLRLLRREHAALGPVHQRGQPGLAAGPLGSHGRTRALLRARVRRASQLLA